MSRKTEGRLARKAERKTKFERERREKMGHLRPCITNSKIGKLVYELLESKGSSKNTLITVMNDC